MRYTLLLIVLLTGCAIQPEYVGIDYPVTTPYYTPTQPPLINYNTLNLQEHLRRSNDESQRLKDFASRSTNRQDLIQAINNSQIANSRLNQLLQNPWNGFYLMR